MSQESRKDVKSARQRIFLETCYFPLASADFRSRFSKAQVHALRIKHLSNSIPIPQST